jgi:hypothetical protein
MDQKHYAIILDSYTGYTAIEFRNKNERKIIETLTPFLHPDYWYHDRVLLAATPRPGDSISQSGRRIQDSSKVKQYFAKTTEKIWQKNNKRPKVFSLHMVLWESE